jgi:tRNA A37 threonylcarbamoyladenosine synthetase subunit TsaC/SUA5/YrdC
MITDHITDLILDLQSIVYPTSTLPGLGCLPVSSALDNLFAIKKRPENMPVSLGVASLVQAKSLVVLPEKALALQKKFPLGAITLVLPSCDSDLDYRLGRTHIAIRVFSHPSARELARRVGQLLPQVLMFLEWRLKLIVKRPRLVCRCLKTTVSRVSAEGV